MAAYYQKSYLQIDTKMLPMGVLPTFIQATSGYNTKSFIS